MKFLSIFLIITAIAFTACTKYEQEEFVPVDSQYIRVNKGVHINVEFNGYITLDARQEGVTSYKWQGNPILYNNLLDSPVVHVYDTGTCVVSFNNGQYTSTVIIVAAPICYIPNSFTPDGYGPARNDTWQPVMGGVLLESYHMRVFSTDNILLYESTDYDGSGWDGTYKGKDCPAGYYYYYLTYTSDIGKDYFKTGYIQLLR